ncbi:hypothetical protein BD626DRAFT_48936 [Schizophyllum amplum]|uniref:Uncharacterized protein n=1 Tax=Schizophyllum amplum TaxID=97359 RepID=A0A550BSP0_9AGAR|nr:hypothetical protein BD626DRAFT_48936 [Auriculariopsis ampla]
MWRRFRLARNTLAFFSSPVKHTRLCHEVRIFWRSVADRRPPTAARPCHRAYKLSSPESSTFLSSISALAGPSDSLALAYSGPRIADTKRQAPRCPRILNMKHLFCMHTAEMCVPEVSEKAVPNSRSASAAREDAPPARSTVAPPCLTTTVSRWGRALRC